MYKKSPLLVDGIYAPSAENKDTTELIEKDKAVDFDLKKTKKQKVSDVESKHLYKKVIIYFSVFVGFFFISSLLLPAVFEYFHKDKVLPGVYVLGEQMGGRSEGELKQDVRTKLEDNRFIFKVGEKEKTAEFYEMGLGIDYLQLSTEAFQAGREGDIIKNFQTRYKSFAYWLSPRYSAKYLTKIGVNVDYSIDGVKLDKFVQGLSKEMNVSEKNAGIVIKGSDVEVIPAQYGAKIITDSLEQQIAQSITKLRDGDKMVLGISTEQVMPAIKEQGLKDTINKAKKMVDADISFVYNDKTYALKKEEKASWIIFEETGNILSPKMDRKKVEGYFTTLAKGINIAAQPKKIRVENGTKELVQEEGKDGLAVDIKQNTDLFIPKAENGESATIGIITRIVKADVKTERVLVADWKRYIDIDLKTQKMTAYENKAPVFSDAITSGKNGYGTPVGTFLIYSKTRSQTMKGGVPGTADYYNLPNVQYISWFNGAIAIHQAWWRSSFGGADYVWNGSHGCINATLASSMYIYNWAPVGTPVVVHY